ncbi:hypothetical protein GCM10017566_31430 [Amycolatopsis bartoniae]|uniref:Serine/threonine protein kinase n=2 Tax=Amycolatopsis bartoniae TaxID=941986 RepID=A0A8H9MDW0_9PSEU|nr:hypothetical protein GCM10017566_31430 [Amycolatopsis bartoniae]
MLVLVLAVAAASLAFVPGSLTEDPVSKQPAAVADSDAVRPLDLVPAPAPPSTVPAAAPVRSSSAPKKPAAAGAKGTESESERAARVSRDAMIPHPRPPAQPNIARTSTSETTIDLGVLTPTPTTRPSY